MRPTTFGGRHLVLACTLLAWSAIAISIVAAPAAQAAQAGLGAFSASPAANAASSFQAFGWGVRDGAFQFETCTSSCESGISGHSAGQLWNPQSVAVDGSGDVYVADSGNNRIDEFSARGAFVKAFGWGVSDGASKLETCTTSCQSGISGAGAGQIDNPLGVAVHGSGNVYVLDTGNQRIDEFSAAGAFVKAAGWGVSDGASQFETCTSSCQSGIGGGGAGQVDYPYGVAVDGSGNVFAPDVGNQRIDEFVYAGVAPSITSAASTSFNVGQDGSFTVTTTGFPAAALSDGEATLPAGVSFTDNGNGTATLTGTPAAGTSGSYPFTITASNGVSPNATQTFTLTVDSSSVTGLSPTAGPTAGGTSVTITGTGFVSGATVKFGSTAATGVTFVSSTHLTAVSPAESAGTVDVTVSTPGGTSATSAADHYVYESVPAVTALSPDAGSTAGGNTVTVTGTGFVSGATVKFGSVAATGVAFVSTNQITATAPAESAGTVNVSVTTPGGSSPAASGNLYAYGPPAVSGLVPNAGSTAGGTSVTINGTNFVSGASVKFGPTAAVSVTFVSATRLTATAPAHPAGVVGVTVTTAGGTSAAVNGALYAYGPPTVSSVVPNAGPTAGGNTVTVNGTGFVPGAIVSFGSTASPAVTFVSATQLTATAPAHAAGAVDVTVTNARGTSVIVAGDRYTYH